MLEKNLLTIDSVSFGMRALKEGVSFSDLNERRNLWGYRINNLKEKNPLALNRFDDNTFIEKEIKIFSYNESRKNVLTLYKKAVKGSLLFLKNRKDN